jgi:tRNA(Phe) wybutosine-synthesizing methylase Tyw3
VRQLTKSEFLRTRVDAETKQKMASEMQRLGINTESEYIRRLVNGEFPLLKEIKEQLDRIEEKVEQKKNGSSPKSMGEVWLL